jgi:hypothetical protein
VHPFVPVGNLRGILVLGKHDKLLLTIQRNHVFQPPAALAMEAAIHTAAEAKLIRSFAKLDCMAYDLELAGYNAHRPLSVPELDVPGLHLV